MKETFLPIISWYMDHINYYTVCLLMAIESTFIPLPSEIVVPPAAWKAAQGELNIALVILSATIGAMGGALFNYCFALFLGRKIIYAFSDTKFAHMIFLTRESVEKAEQFFLKYGKSSTFIGRLVPGVRHLISLPAGLAKMNLKPFFLYTFIGAGIWNVILALLGYFLYSQKEALNKYFKEISVILLVLGVLFVAYVVFRSVRRPRARQPSE